MPVARRLVHIDLLAEEAICESGVISADKIVVPDALVVQVKLAKILRGKILINHFGHLERESLSLCLANLLGACPGAIDEVLTQALLDVAFSVLCCFTQDYDDCYDHEDQLAEAILEYFEAFVRLLAFQLGEPLLLGFMPLL